MFLSSIVVGEYDDSLDRGDTEGFFDVTGCWWPLFVDLIGVVTVNFVDERPDAAIKNICQFRDDSSNLK